MLNQCVVLISKMTIMSHDDSASMDASKNDWRIHAAEVYIHSICIPNMHAGSPCYIVCKTSSK